MKKGPLVVLLLMILGLGIWVINYLAILPQSLADKLPFASPTSSSETLNPRDSSTVEYRLEEVITGLEVPWDIVFTDPQRMLITERNGSVRVVNNGVLQAEPLTRFSDVSTSGEEGLMGMTLDPNYSTNKFIYVCLAYPQGENLADKVIRVKDLGTSLEEETVILDSIPAAQFHAGCQVAFGPDGKLYITTGDATDRHLAQKPDSLAGKILRLNSDGSIPDDNPFPGSAIYSLGHRNPQGLDWHPQTQALYETEHGPSGFDGPGGGDEVNLIKAGQNYGWPLVSHTKSREGLVDPLLVFTPAVAPGSGAFYSGEVFPQFKNNFFFGGLKGEGLYRVVLDSTAGEKVLGHEKLKDITVGRVRFVTTGPDGFIYFTSSNRDGRGKPQPNDDKIYRLVPR